MKIARGKAQVAGIEFSIFSDFAFRGMTAINQATGEEKVIKRHGYVSTDLSIRKAVAAAFGLPTFQKKSKWLEINQLSLKLRLANSGFHDNVCTAKRKALTIKELRK